VVQQIEGGFVAWCAIEVAAKRALYAMLCHRQMRCLDLVGAILACHETEEVAVFESTVGLDQLAGELIEMCTVNGIHDASPSNQVGSLRQEVVISNVRKTGHQGRSRWKIRCLLENAHERHIAPTVPHSSVQKVLAQKEKRHPLMATAPRE